MKKNRKNKSIGKWINLIKPDLVNLDTLLLQIIPSLIGIIIGIIALKIDELFQVSIRNPYFFELIWSIILFIWSISYLVAIIRKEFYQPIVIRGKPAVVIGVIGFATCLFLGGGLLIRYIIDTSF